MRGLGTPVRGVTTVATKAASSATAATPKAWGEAGEADGGEAGDGSRAERLPASWHLDADSGIDAHRRSVRDATLDATAELVASTAWPP